MASHGNGYDRAAAVKDFDDSKIGVKGLSDSGITSIPSIFLHPPQTLSDLRSCSPTDAAIPVIDLSDVSSQARRSPKLVQQIREAAKTWGFFQVINHGVDVSVLDETIAAIKAFHDQPQHVKAKYYKREEGRGVMFASNNDLYRTDAASWHDSLQAWMTPEAPKAEDLPEICGREMLAWDSHAKGVAETVMELLGEGLGLDRGKFKELTFSESRAIVGHIYPYCPQPDLTMGITPHTDPGIITVLLQNQVAGLQVKHGHHWVPVNPLPGALIINVGDMLQIISNGEYTSVQHRVLANAEKSSRISIVMFLNLSKWRGSDGPDGYYGPLPELVSPEKPPLYRDFTAKEFIDNFYGNGIDTKSLPQKLEIQH
ncbi:1-aminocyclopropane-1-carboxylate oxidase homolog 4-like [Prosopis cineraria]|uniref:1-aminocyclopropane-1-carboxylate oxidase homolog 4-like n=1 Tax=Prosopis cineraria TaxID=364024 RepID=UPI00240FA050|nr:1-aminocyclopropane-1-carboxylate oxidase homolog 4-like [Prosopis cineraria]